MKVLVIGGGGREHALVWKISQSKNAEKIFCAPGNAGIKQIAETVDINADEIEELKKFVVENKIDFTVVGPDNSLALGIVDEFVKDGLKIFGPTKAASKLEWSKSFAKDFMKRHGIPTADFQKFSFSEKDNAIRFVENTKYPLVIKADGLALGKGVAICENVKSAKETIRHIFDEKIFGDAGNEIVIEEFLEGNEVSLFAVSDGKNHVVLPSSQDHKKIFDGEKGKNTGGMGSYAQAKKIVDDSVLKKVDERIINPVIENMKKEGNEFKGCLYCGLMIDEHGNPFVIEFNARLGDPETQVVLPLIKSDFLELLYASANGNLKDYKLEIHEGHCCCVVLASEGYPDKYETEKEISNIEKFPPDCFLFHAGTKINENGKLVTSGGRVLNAVGKSNFNLKEAVKNAYVFAKQIKFENKYYRRDIGAKGL